ncbi:ABC transporter [Microbacterium sp. CJ88]|uniref:ABC transporter n=1 Tax=Microbacterium sp. CJ88 TaxID=3445672 RepID=UPI003F658D62
MSDQKSSYGEPVEESTNVDDVVGRAHEGLADAEAARRDAVVVEPAVVVPADEAVVVERHDEPVVVETVAAERPADSGDLDPIYAQHAHDAAETSVISERVDDAPTVVAAPVVAPSEPVYPSYEEPAYVAPAAAQPIFVQAPEQPRPRGNRGAAGAIGLLAALAFAVLYLGAWLGFGAINGDVTVDNVGSTALGALTTFGLWVPVAVFFIAFWLLGAIINRGRWGAWVILGVLVGVASYGGHILGQLFDAPFWALTVREGATVAEGQLLAPLAIAAFVFGRELTIWFGAWVSARGRRMTELNIEAQREYERTLEAGPQLVRQ